MSADTGADGALSYNRLGLTHWLVSDVAGHAAALYGLHEEAEWLRDLGVPTSTVSPTGSAAVLRRVLAAATSAQSQMRAKAQEASAEFCLPMFRLPTAVEEAFMMVASGQLWLGARRTAQQIADVAIGVEATRDMVDELGGQPFNNDGWLHTVVWAMEMDLRDHAREVNRWPIIEGEVEMMLGGHRAYWPADALSAL